MVTACSGGGEYDQSNNAGNTDQSIYYLYTKACLFFGLPKSVSWWPTVLTKNWGNLNFL